MSASPDDEARPFSFAATTGAGGANRAATRIVAALLAALCVFVLATAATLDPSPRGYGTHQRLGFGPCGTLLTTGYPCPSCGMTTAFAHVVRGQLLAGLRVQPAGFVLALATLGVLAGSTWTLLRGRPPRVPLVLSPYRLCAAFLLLLLGGWLFKVILGWWTGEYPVRTFSSTY